MGPSTTVTSFPSKEEQMTTRMQRQRRFHAIFMAATLIGTYACGTDSCPEGGKEIGGRCVANMDGGTASSSAEDGSTAHTAKSDAGTKGDKDAGDAGDAGDDKISAMGDAGSGDSGPNVMPPCDCDVAGDCFVEGDLNPDNDCEVCDPMLADDAFSPNDGAVCHSGLSCATEGTCTKDKCVPATTCDDGLACTTDSCDTTANKCVFEITTGCVIDGACVDEGALDTTNSCLSCDSSTNTDDYTALPTSTVCTTQDPTRVALECSASAECGVPYCDVYDCWTVVPTGQTQCSVNGNLDSCPGVAGTGACASTVGCGQDAQYPAPSERMYSRTSGGEPIVTDSHTGLVWQGTITDCGSSSTSCSHSNANLHCFNLTYGGYNDWRMPTLYELLDLIAPGNLNPGTMFPDPATPMWDSWSSTSLSTDTTAAWLMTYQFAGQVSTHDKASGTFPVRCVRGATLGRNNPDRYFAQDNAGDVVVLDRATGLQWQQESASGLQWTEALAYCEGLVYGGHSNWRLPDMQELASLLDFGLSAPPISSMPGAVAENFWSSSHATFAADSSMATPVFFDGGTLVISGFAEAMDSLYSARCVWGP